MLKASWSLGGSGLGPCINPFRRGIRERLRRVPAIITVRQRGEYAQPTRHAVPAVACHAERSGDLGWFSGVPTVD